MSKPIKMQLGKGQISVAVPKGEPTTLVLGLMDEPAEIGTEGANINSQPILALEVLSLEGLAVLEKGIAVIKHNLKKEMYEPLPPELRLGA